MLTLADVVRQHAPSYLSRYGTRVLPGHRRALRAIGDCRTEAMGAQLHRCLECGSDHLRFLSCRHRACPRCGFDQAQRWLDRQRRLLLPAPYFHVVFTLPDVLRPWVRSHQRTLLDVLFRCAFSSLQQLCLTAPHLRGRIGALAVLHTWTRTLTWHPHVHMLVPGGAVDPHRPLWRDASTKSPFLVPVRALSKLFRGRFLHEARRRLRHQGIELPYLPGNTPWVVFAKPVAHHPNRVLDYLGRYVNRTAITDTSLIESTHDAVAFCYRDSRSGTRKTMSLAPHEFLRRFLQHVLPKGFHRIRAYGLLHPAHRDTLRTVQVALAHRSTPPPPATPPAASAQLCPTCRRPALRLVRRLTPAQCRARGPLGTTTHRPSSRAPPPTAP